MPHHNQEPWDETLRAKIAGLGMPQGTLLEDDGQEVNGVYVPGPGDVMDDAIAAVLNAEIVELPERFIDVATQSIMQYMVERQALFPIKKAARSGSQEADSFVDLVTIGGTIRGSSDDDRKLFFTLLDALASVLDAALSDAIKAMFSVNETMPYWQSIGAPGPFNRYDLHRVRTP